MTISSWDSALYNTALLNYWLCDRISFLSDHSTLFFAPFTTFCMVLYPKVLSIKKCYFKQSALYSKFPAFKPFFYIFYKVQLNFTLREERQIREKIFLLNHEKIGKNNPADFLLTIQNYICKITSSMLLFCNNSSYNIMIMKYFLNYRSMNDMKQRLL